MSQPVKLIALLEAAPGMTSVSSGPGGWMTCFGVPAYLEHGDERR